VVLVDHAAEDLPALHRRVQRHDDRPVLIRRPLLPGLMRTMPDRRDEYLGLQNPRSAFWCPLMAQ
jgi:hypothetical protein